VRTDARAAIAPAKVASSHPSAIIRRLDRSVERHEHVVIDGHTARLSLERAAQELRASGELRGVTV
jgi:hypothetical protein